MSATPKTFLFTAESEALAKAAIAKYPEGRQRSAVMPLLDIAQRQSGGWLPMPAIEYVALYLDMPAIRVLEVASFYTMYNLKPVGRHHVQVCTNLPCWLRGSDNIAHACKHELGVDFGETTADGQFTLSEVECLGACVNAPMMQIGDDYYEDLDKESTVNILKELRAGGQPMTGSHGGRYTCEPMGGLTSLNHQDDLRAEKVAARAGAKTTGGDDWC
ncbi:MAG: NADH-quinone oxidoreductase subunit NuoE [Proteobacteria bacterium]|nr:NADH-quinone oxidoreductase subunit NuoE [Pseudomonadota bacterium]